MLWRCGETGQPGGPFFKITILCLAVFEDFVLCSGHACGDGRMVRCAVGACVIDVPTGGGEGAIVAGLPFAGAELFKIGHRDVVIGVCAHAVDHDDQHFRLKFILRGKRQKADC